MSRRRPLSEAEQRHADWLGMLQPEGLVVSIRVLVDADAYVRQPTEVQERLRELAPDDRLADRAAFDRVLTDVLRWPLERLADPTNLEGMAVALPDLGEVLRPDAALVDREGRPLIFVAWTSGTLDEQAGTSHWPISRQGRFERLLLESQGPTGGGAAIGLHACPTAIRLTYAPRGEAPGSLTFPIEALTAWDGRILVDALCMLVGRDRLFTVASEHRLPALLRESRQRQEKVTEELAGQVEEALQILVAGFDVANQRMNGRLLRDYAEEEGVEDFRAGLVTVLLRLVFLLYCEDQGVLPTDNSFYAENYSLARLADQLQEERVLYPEAMRHRYGAWARLCALFRLVWSGARHKDLTLPARQGDLFDPHRFLFLEGRLTAGDDDGELPPVDDGVVDDVLDRLVYLEGQRLSYRNLDVEQIGSVYEALMAVELRRARSLALPLRGGGWVEVEDILGADRPSAVVAAAADLKPAELAKRAPGLAAFEAAGDWADPVAELREVLTPLLRQDIEPRQAGQHYLGAGSERRRTGSHYTPTTLTRPIVERTLSPVVDRDGPPSSKAILALKVCDPAMGSGAFLAETCRYLARRLLDAWTREGMIPEAARRGDPLLYARRLVAERCIYGVDKNPFAVQLARLSLWLVTLAKDLPFTFVDHALREGDAVIGLTTTQIAAFSFDAKSAAQLFAHSIRRSIKDAVRDRAQILEPDLFSWKDKTRALTNALDEVETARVRGDLLLASFWAGGAASEMKKRIQRLHPAVDAWFLSDGEQRLDQEWLDLRAALPIARPFHWELEFPEVFARENPGFDAVVGNPPFGGQETIRLANGGPQYIKLLQALNPHAHGSSDLVAHFFLRAAWVLRAGACFGLVATNSVKQGNTRDTGLKHIIEHRGITVWDAILDQPWSGGAAVVVDVVHACRGTTPTGRRLNSSLVEAEELADPLELKERAFQAFEGTKVYGKGFVLAPGEASEFLAANELNARVVRPFIGGEQLNGNGLGPDGMVTHDRYVIDFGERSLAEAGAWPDLLRVVEERVRPEREKLTTSAGAYWWRFERTRPELYSTIQRLPRCFVAARVSKHWLVSAQPVNRVFTDKVVVFAFADWASFAILQSRVHEAWAWTLATTMKTDLSYAPSRCFETFPFPRPADAQRVAIAAAGEALHGHRAALMARFNEGMTKIWNRLLNQDETDSGVLRLRELREAMDRAVLDAYGWSDVSPTETAEIVKRLRVLNAARAAEEKSRR